MGIKILKHGGPSHPSCHLFKDLRQAAEYIHLEPILPFKQVLSSLTTDGEVIDFEGKWTVLESQYMVDHTKG